MKVKIVKYIFLLLYVLSFGYHCYSSLQSGEASSGLSKNVAEVVVEIEEKVFHVEVTDFDKVHNSVRKLIGHFAYFGLISIFGFLCIYFYTLKLSKTLIISSIIGAIMAAISEILQIFADARGPSIKDALIDYGGYSVSTIIMFLIIFLVLKRKTKNSQMGVKGN